MRSIALFLLVLVLAISLVACGSTESGTVYSKSSINATVSKASAASLETQIAQLYIASFNRVPDAAGLAFWVDSVTTGGVSLEQVSKFFTDSPEYIDMYPSLLSNSDYVEKIYVNVFGRASDAGGKAFWTGHLDSGSLNRGNIMLALLDAAHSAGNTDGDRLDNISSFGLWALSSGFDSVRATTYLSSITSDPSTVSAAIQNLNIPHIPPITTFIGTYKGITNGGPFTTDPTTTTVDVIGSKVTITVSEFFSGTCKYTGDILENGNTILNGTYQCSDFSVGNWSLVKINILDADDLYLSISKNSSSVVRFYGMKLVSNNYQLNNIIENIYNKAGSYDGVTYSRIWGTDSTDTNITIQGSTLTITQDEFFTGTCRYVGTISSSGNDITNGTYQCSDFTSGTWSLAQMRTADYKDIYVVISRSDNQIKRFYGMSGK